MPARGTRLKTFRDAIRTEDFVVTATLPLRQSTTREHVESYAARLKPFVHGLQLSDNWQADGHMDVLAAASILLNKGIDPVVHLCCRDRNRVALQGCLLGAAALGVSSLLLSRGQKLAKRFQGKVKGVFDTQPAQLFGLAQQFDSNSDGASGSKFLINIIAITVRLLPYSRICRMPLDTSLKMLWSGFQKHWLFRQALSTA